MLSESEQKSQTKNRTNAPLMTTSMILNLRCHKCTVKVKCYIFQVDCSLRNYLSILSYIFQCISIRKCVKLFTLDIHVTLSQLRVCVWFRTCAHEVVITGPAPPDRRPGCTEHGRWIGPECRGTQPQSRTADGSQSQSKTTAHSSQGPSYWRTHFKAAS